MPTRPEPQENHLVYDLRVRDLEPRKDPKGGSPKTPLPQSIKKAIANDDSAQIYVGTPDDHPKPHGMGIAGVIISILSTALLGMIVAWWTALHEQGVTRTELELYVRNNTLQRTDMEYYVQHYSPYNLDKGGIEAQQATQNKSIGQLEGSMARMMERVDKIEGRKE